MNFWLVVAIFLASGVTAQRCLDTVLSHQFRDAYDEWERDGKPCGYNWRAPGRGIFEGGWARGRVERRWSRIDPPWASESDKRLLRIWRVAVIAEITAFFTIPIAAVSYW